MKKEKELIGVIDDGTRAIPIENRFGKKICTIYIRPGDLSIIDRYQDAMRALPEIVKPLQEMDIDSDGTAANNDKWEILKNVEKNLYQQIDSLFDMDEAEEIFAKRNPFSSVNGRFFCEIVIEAIGEIIERVMNEEAEKTKERTKKYLSDLEGKGDVGESAEES